MKNVYILEIIIVTIQVSLFITEVYSYQKLEDPELLERVHKILNTTTEKNTSPKSRAEELDTWRVPEYLLKNYPYYLSGFDYEGRPIWIAQWGKFNLKKIVQDGKESQELFSKYVEKTARILRKSGQILSTPEHPVNEAAFILDFADLNFEQIADIETVSYALKLAQLYADDIIGGTNKVVVVNVNHVAQLAVRLAKMVLGSVFHKIDVFGSNKAQWIPQLRRLFPPESLPEEYGGEKAHKPLFIYG
ncbi:unnamed protein product [Allacma fusca]|uniref:CRAL-TRIO domain-containing protein n=1 Tax=Allacma fusca TaxID=39272 RepID=A0A8J2NXV5_9HEXA|nr:unnamed protein product [Allacma fusca]